MRSIGNSCLCRPTAKILVLALGLQLVSRASCLEGKLNEEWMREIYMLCTSAYVPHCVCDELLRVVTLASLLPSNSRTRFLFHSVMGRGFWEF